ncbi:methyltransferase-domain-containing protein [Apiospora hydei]|uniref:Protein-lysine N-methyltransferase EFM6 n=1 Tax=Apiospora hydei TaxID=1337664 RepID=A0ABR1WMR7_9PEZI
MESKTSRSPSPEFSPLAIGTDLAPPRELKAAATTDLDFSGLLADAIQLHEDLKSGNGGQAWPAGMVLAKHMLRYHRNDLQNSRMYPLVCLLPGNQWGVRASGFRLPASSTRGGENLELGAGGGLVGLGVASGCDITQPVYVTDQVNMLPLMEKNVALNKLGSKVQPAVLNWGEPLGSDVINFKPDVILAADCVYFEPAFPLLLATLSDLLALCPSATIYFCFKKRRRADMQFLKKAQKAFQTVELVDQDREVFSRENIFLYSFRKRDVPDQSQWKGYDSSDVQWPSLPRLMLKNAGLGYTDFPGSFSLAVRQPRVLLKFSPILEVVCSRQLRVPTEIRVPRPWFDLF